MDAIQGLDNPRGQAPRKGHGRPHAEVDFPGNDDQCHAEGDDALDGDVAKHIEEVVHGQEEAFGREGQPHTKRHRRDLRASCGDRGRTWPQYHEVGWRGDTGFRANSLARLGVSLIHSFFGGWRPSRRLRKLALIGRAFGPSLWALIIRWIKTPRAWSAHGPVVDCCVRIPDCRPGRMAPPPWRGRNKVGGENSPPPILTFPLQGGRNPSGATLLPGERRTF